MIATIAGAATGAIGSIFGGISAAKKAREARAKQEEERQKNEAWYQRRYNEDATQRADTRAQLARLEELTRNRNRAARAKAIVGGASEEAIAAETAENSRAISDTATNIAAQGQARKDAVEAQYRNRDASIREAQAAADMQQAGAISQAIGGVAKTAGSLVASSGSTETPKGAGNNTNVQETPQIDTTVTGKEYDRVIQDIDDPEYKVGRSFPFMS